MGKRLDRAQRQAEQPCHVGLGQVFVVAQDQHGPLAGGEAPNRRPQHQPVLAEVGLDSLLGAPAGQVPGLDRRPAQQ
jgi:hypothetical protein